MKICSVPDVVINSNRSFNIDVDIAIDRSSGQTVPHSGCDTTASRQGKRGAGNNLGQIVVVAILAIATTVITTSLTHYLLSRPWCFDAQASGGQTILYGAKQCANHLAPRTSSNTIVE